jgi:hypothetical protein
MPPADFGSGEPENAESFAPESAWHRRDALAPEFKLLNPGFGVSIRRAATAGLLVILTLIFVIFMPGFRRGPDAASSFTADVRQFKMALPPSSLELQSSEAAAKPVIRHLQQPLASSSEPAAQADRDRSDELLQRFMQWRLKKSSAENVQLPKQTRRANYICQIFPSFRARCGAPV